MLRVQYTLGFSVEGRGFAIQGKGRAEMGVEGFGPAIIDSTALILSSDGPIDTSWTISLALV